MATQKVGVSAAVALVLATAVAGCKVFVPDREYVNGGLGSASAERLARTGEDGTVPSRWTETRLRWASREGGAPDRESTSNPATLQYGHKEKPKKPVKAPVLKLTKLIKDGKRVCTVLSYDKPPPDKLIYRLKVANIGSATYRGPLELVDQLPSEVRYLGIKAVHKRHLVWLPYIGNVETKSKLKGWQVDPPSGGMGTRVRWWIDDVKLKKRHWITVDIEFDPPPFDISSAVVRVARPGAVVAR